MSIVEKMARAIFEHWQFQALAPGTRAGQAPIKWVDGGNGFKQEEATDYARAALTATGLTEAQLEGLANGAMVVTRKDTLEGLMPSDLMIGPSATAMLAAKEG